VTAADVQEWIAGLALKPASIRRYLATLRAILDFADIDPNPARDRRVKLPREEHVPVDPPSASEVETVIQHSPRRWRLGLRTLAETGLRSERRTSSNGRTSMSQARGSASATARRPQLGGGSRCLAT